MADRATVSLEQDRGSVRVHRGTNPPVEESAKPRAEQFSAFAILSAIVYHSVDDELEPPASWAPSPDALDKSDDPETSLYYRGVGKYLKKSMRGGGGVPWYA